jgi:hypothetical protein
MVENRICSNVHANPEILSTIAWTLVSTIRRKCLIVILSRWFEKKTQFLNLSNVHIGFAEIFLQTTVLTWHGSNVKFPWAKIVNDFFAVSIQNTGHA